MFEKNIRLLRKFLSRNLINKYPANNIFKYKRVKRLEQTKNDIISIMKHYQATLIQIDRAIKRIEEA